MPNHTLPSFIFICLFLISVVFVSGCFGQLSHEQLSATPVCGNNKLEADELCDSSQLGDKSCQTFGFASGALKCMTDCKNFDTNSCVAYGLLTTKEAFDILNKEALKLDQSAKLYLISTSPQTQSFISQDGKSDDWSFRFTFNISDDVPWPKSQLRAWDWDFFFTNGIISSQGASKSPFVTRLLGSWLDSSQLFKIAEDAGASLASAESITFKQYYMLEVPTAEINCIELKDGERLKDSILINAETGEVILANLNMRETASGQWGS